MGSVRRCLVVGAAALVLLAAAQVARAANLCVNETASGCATTYPTIDAAVQASNTTYKGEASNTISVGSGTYQEDGLAVGGAGVPAVQLVGSGAGTLIEQVSNPMNGFTAVRLAAGSSISDLAIDTGTSQIEALDDSGTASGLTIHASSSPVVAVEGSATLRNSSVTNANTASTATAIATYGTRSSPPTVDDVSVTGSTGVTVLTSANLRRLTIHAPQGLFSPAWAGGGTTVLDDSLIVTPAGSGNFGAQAVLTSYLNGGSGVESMWLRHDTFVGGGSGDGVDAEALNSESTPQVVTVHLEGSIVRGYSTSLKAATSQAGSGSAEAQIYEFASDYDPNTTETSETTPGTAVVNLCGSSCIDSDPLWRASGSGDFRLRIGSPGIDAGGQLDPGNGTNPPAEAALDLAGKPRVAGLATDMGAYEYQGAPVAALGASTTNVVAGTTVSFDASNSSVPDGSPHYQWDLDGNGSFETDTGATPTASRQFTTPGSYRVTVRASDGAGGSSEQSITITAHAASAGPAAPSAPTSIPQSPTAQSQLTPTLTGFSLTHTRFAPTPAPPRGQRRHGVSYGSAFHYVLTAASSVTITITKQTNGRRVSGRCATPTRENTHRPQCTRLVNVGSLAVAGTPGAHSASFGGRLRGHALTPGSYTATIIAVDAGRHSAPVTLQFTILKR